MKFVSSLPRTSALASLGAVILASAVVAAQPFVVPNAPRFPLSLEPRIYDTSEQKIKVTVIAHGIPRPWALLPLPDGDILVSVRATGQIFAVRKDKLDPVPLTGLPAMHLSRPTGMLDMALHHIQEEEDQFFPMLEQANIDLTPIGLEMASFEANLIHMQAQAGGTAAAT